MESSVRITRSRGGEQGRTLRNRPPTPRTSGAVPVIRTPSPNRARRPVSGGPTTALSGRDEQMDGEAQPNQENQPSPVAPSVQGEVQPQDDQQQQGNPGDVSGQPASDQSRPPTCELSLDPEVGILFGREIGQSNGDILLTI
jgi:hypothetical protein